MSRKSNGQGHTYKIGGSYRTVIRHNGSAITAMAKTHQESRKRAKEKLESHILNELNPSKTDYSQMPLEEYLSTWLETEHRHYIAHSTYKRYDSLARNHINPLIGKTPICDITPRVITDLLNRMREGGQGIRSQQQARALLSITLANAESLEYIPSNPVRKVRNPKSSERNFSPLSLEEVKRLLQTYEGTYLCARLHLALVCGLRQGEALGLQWKNVDLDKGTLEIVSQIQIVNRESVFVPLKTERSKRTVFLTQATVQALRGHQVIVNRLKLQPGFDAGQWDLVFPRNDGSPRSTHTDYDEWHKALKLCGIAPRRLHDARHTAATLMYANKVGIETISRALGHSSSAITSRLYVHSAEEPLRQAANSLQSVLE
jgi:integrase